MNSQQMVQALRGCGPGSMLFVSYLAADPTPSKDVPADQCRRHYVGTLSSLWITQEGHVVLTMFVENRRQFRTINPALGNLLSIEVLDRVRRDPESSLFECAQKLPDPALAELAIKLGRLIAERRQEGKWPHSRS